VIPEQGSSSSAGGAGELYGMKAKKEIELAVLEQRMSGDDPAIAQLELEIREIDRKLETFPEIGIESIRLYRDVVIQQKILEILLPLYEQAKVDEQKDVPVLLVLDRAVVAENKTVPKRSLVVFASASIVLLLSLLMAVALDRSADLPGPLGVLLRRWSAAIAGAYRVTRPA
jgi:tyrosine-protein kinase Etk/Wzc